MFCPSITLFSLKLKKKKVGRTGEGHVLSRRSWAPGKQTRREMLPSLALKPPEPATSPRNLCLMPVFLPSQEGCVPQNLRIMINWNRHSWEAATDWDSWQFCVLPHRSTFWGTQTAAGDPEWTCGPCLGFASLLHCGVVHRQGSNHTALLKTLWCHPKSTYKVQIPLQHSRSPKI